MLIHIFLYQWMIISLSDRKRWYAVCDKWQKKFEVYASNEFRKEYLEEDK
jgi:hypothetical protein